MEKQPCLKPAASFFFVGTARDEKHAGTTKPHKHTNYGASEEKHSPSHNYSPAAMNASVTRFLANVPRGARAIHGAAAKKSIPVPRGMLICRKGHIHDLGVIFNLYCVFFGATTMRSFTTFKTERLSPIHVWSIGHYL